MITLSTRALRVIAPLAALAAVAACGSSNKDSSGSAPSSAAATSAASSAAPSSSSSAPSDDGYGGSSSSASAPASKPAEKGETETISVATAAKLGKILVDGEGKTVYLFEKDKTAKSSTCYTACAVAWPPVTTAEAPKAGMGAKASLITTLTRTDGTKQVVYNGHPLYYFQGDTKAGMTTGQDLKGFGAPWYVLSPSGVKVGD